MEFEEHLPVQMQWFNQLGNFTAAMTSGLFYEHMA
jgi:hypothetical protein